MKLYLACGMDRMEGHHHVDINVACKPEQVWDLLDLSRRWPWSNVSHIELRHFIEHIPHGDGGKDHFIRFFERCWHVLRPNGTMAIRWPWYQSIGAYSDPTHRRFITPLTFSYLSKKWLKERNIEHYDMACDFEVVSNAGAVAQSIEHLQGEERDRAIQTQWNAAHEGITQLRAIK